MNFIKEGKPEHQHNAFWCPTVRPVVSMVLSADKTWKTWIDKEYDRSDTQDNEWRFPSGSLDKRKRTSNGTIEDIR